MAYPATSGRDGEQRVVPTERARQGEATGHVRYVLGASLILAVAAGAFLYMIYFV